MCGATEISGAVIVISLMKQQVPNVCRSSD
jgi:hypothetical protein